MHALDFKLTIQMDTEQIIQLAWKNQIEAYSVLSHNYRFFKTPQLSNIQITYILRFMKKIMNKQNALCTYLEELHKDDVQLLIGDIETFDFVFRNFPGFDNFTPCPYHSSQNRKCNLFCPGVFHPSKIQANYARFVPDQPKICSSTSDVVESIGSPGWEEVMAGKIEDLTMQDYYQ